MLAEHAGGRLISVLEGGYDLNALAHSVSVHVETLLMTESNDVDSPRVL